LLAVAVFAARPSDAFAAADRYGGVWHEGKGTGAFVPISAGMTWTDVLNYRMTWGNLYSYRISDIEVVPKGCPSDRRDLFATQWEEGKWHDKLYVVSSLAEFQSAVASECRRGYRLKDFELWDSKCDEPVKYILLFRQDGKPCQYTPLINSDAWTKFGGLVSTYGGFGYTLVDFEMTPGPTLNDPNVMGVWYYGPSTQKFEVQTREQFEADMKAQEGLTTLMDMESFRRIEGGIGVLYWKRYVAGLWETLPTNADDHEVGEVYTKFKDLIYKQSAKRQLVDFEVYPDTNDDRFGDTFKSYLQGIGGGYAFAVLQSGELVAGDGEGYARQPADGNVGMTIQVPGPVASVTKFFTALGVLRFAETQPNVNAWLDEPMVQHLPGDFGPFGAGVGTVTIRQLLSQKTGLATFVPSQNADFVTNPAGWRQEMIAWLGQPLADFSKQYKYQNIHFELLALIMDEVELPPIVNSATPWRDWMIQQVFANAGVGALYCGGTASDALSYPLNNSQGGKEWIDSSWDCAGNGTGVGMFWASALDLARLNSAFRKGSIVSPSTVTMALAQGLGLDPPYPDTDGDATTTGDRLYTKNGGLCAYNGNGDSVGSDTLIARFDDYNFDDDWFSPAPPQTNDYVYEVGHRDFDVGIMIHGSAYAGVCYTARSFPIPKAMLQEALRRRENW
jgi:CubicO group peptidase (beta-lactamase class C family)